MSRRWNIQPVPQSKRTAAIRFVAGGRGGAFLSGKRTDAISRMVEAHDPEKVTLRWARSWRKTLAAALILESPGRTGMLFHSPADAPGVDPDALTELVRSASEDVLSGGASLVQALVGRNTGSDIPVLEQAGFQRLAELVYMRLSLGKIPASPSVRKRRAELTWKDATQIDDALMGQVVARTYEGSLDCPLLSGRREMSDVLAGHKSSGEFSPRTWWVPFRGEQPVGCILTNDFPSLRSSEVVYLGVLPECRGTGIASAMVYHAAMAACERGRQYLTLAVDSSNVYAMEVYQKSGFIRVDVREAFVRLAT